MILAASTTGCVRFGRLVRSCVVATLLVSLSYALAQDAPAQDAPAVPEAGVVNVYYFWGDGCPVCAHQRAYLDWLEEHHPGVEVHAFEVYFETRNRVLLEAFSRAFGQPVRGVPVTFIGDQGWIGFNQPIGLQMTARVEADLAEPGPDAADRLDPDVRQAFLSEPETRN